MSTATASTTYASTLIHDRVYSAEEAERHRRELEGAARRRPAVAAPIAAHSPRMKVTCFDQIDPTLPEYLWEHRIPKGVVCTLYGPTSTGKSLLTLSIAATVATEGATFPDGTQPPHGDVLILAGEDAAPLQRMRLDALGADLSRIHIIEGVEFMQGDDPDMIQLAQHCGILNDAIGGYPNAQFAIIDPLLEFCQGVDTHKSAEVRQITRQLRMIAESQKISLMCVSHPNKNAGGSASHRMAGSEAWASSSRTLYATGFDPADTERDPNKRRKCMVFQKGNYTTATGGFYYYTRPYEAKPGQIVPFIDWGDECHLTVEEVLDATMPSDEQRSESSECESWLQNELDKASGKLERTEAYRDGAKLGFNIALIRKAARALKLPTPKPDGFGGKYYFERGES